MTNEDIALFCSIGKIYPGKYDVGGWCTFLNVLQKLGMDVDEQMKNLESLPKTKKEIESLADGVRKRMATPTELDNQNKMMVVAINADEFWAKSEDKQIKEFMNFIKTTESLDFPPYVLEMDPILQNYITENFMYTYGKDGSAIVYSRALDAQGTVWEEVGDSEQPFTKTKGTLRSKLIDALVIRSKSKVVTVYVGDGDKQKVYQHIPYYKLHRKNFEKTMSRVEGTEPSVKLFRDRLNGWINVMKRCYEGKLKDNELQRGMLDIPTILEGLDKGIDNNTFFYHDKIDLPMLTNDPTEPALAYFDLGTIQEGPTPDFDGFMKSIHPSCRDSLMAAIYATFFGKCKLNQYIWIHGEGGDGKSSLLNAIAKFAGDRLACSLGQNDIKSEFGLENCVGKRVVIMSDVKTGLSVKSSLVHNLTGHDLISVNRKGKPIISVRLNPIVWIAANDAPDVNFDNRNEARRCLYIKMIEPPVEIQKKFYFVNPDGSFVVDKNGRKVNNGYDLEGNMVKEMPHILYKCKQAFERVCPAPYSVIKPDLSALELAEENCLDIDAATYNTYIVETFSFGNPEAKMLQTDIFEAIQETMKNHGDKSSLNNFAKRDIRRLLTVNYSCKRKKIEGIYYMTGICRKLDGMSPVANPATGRPVYVPDQPIKMPEQPSIGDFV